MIIRLRWSSGAKGLEFKFPVASAYLEIGFSDLYLVHWHQVRSWTAFNSRSILIMNVHLRKLACISCGIIDRIRD